MSDLLRHRDLTENETMILELLQTELRAAHTAAVLDAAELGHAFLRAQATVNERKRLKDAQASNVLNLVHGG